MPVTHTYHHRPKPDPEDARQCGVCGDPINQAAPTLHAGERPHAPAADPHNATILDHATRIIQAEVAELPLYLTDEQLALVARVAAEALYYRGGLKTRRSSWQALPGSAA